jgi:exodeoxyribonuclease VII small subunit
VDDQLKMKETRTKKAPAAARTFEQSMTALEEIVEELERGDLPLEESLKLFEQGVKLSRECQERLRQAERRIEQLLSDDQGAPVLADFADAKQQLSEDDPDSHGDDETLF